MLKSDSGVKGSGKPVQNVHKDLHISSHYTLAKNKVSILLDSTIACAAGVCNVRDCMPLGKMESQCTINTL